MAENQQPQALPYCVPCPPRGSSPFFDIMLGVAVGVTVQLVINYLTRKRGNR